MDAVKCLERYLTSNPRARKAIGACGGVKTLCRLLGECGHEIYQSVLEALVQCVNGRDTYDEIEISSTNARELADDATISQILEMLSTMQERCVQAALNLLSILSSDDYVCEVLSTSDAIGMIVSTVLKNPSQVLQIMYNLCAKSNRFGHIAREHIFTAQGIPQAVRCIDDTSLDYETRALACGVISCFGTESQYCHHIHEVNGINILIRALQPDGKSTQDSNRLKLYASDAIFEIMETDPNALGLLLNCNGVQIYLHLLSDGDESPLKLKAAQFFHVLACAVGDDDSWNNSRSSYDSALRRNLISMVSSRKESTQEVAYLALGSLCGAPRDEESVLGIARSMATPAAMTLRDEIISMILAPNMVPTLTSTTVYSLRRAILRCMATLGSDAGQISRLFDAGCLRALTSVLQSSEESGDVDAMDILYDMLAGHIDWAMQRQQMDTTAAVYAVFHCLQADDIQSGLPAIRLVEIFFQNNESCRCIIGATSSILNRVIEYLQMDQHADNPKVQSEELVASAAQIIALIAQSDPEKAHLAVQQGAHFSLLELLKQQSSSRVILCTLRALGSMARNENTHRELVASSLIPLQEMLASEDPKCLVATLEVIYYLTLTKTGSTALATDEFVSLIARVELNSNDRIEELRDRIMLNLAGNRTMSNVWWKHVISDKKLELALDMLKIGDEEIQKNALEAIGKLATEEMSPQILQDPTAVSTLCQFLMVSSVETKSKAVQCLSTLYQNGNYLGQHFLKKQPLTALAALLQSNPSDVVPIWISLSREDEVEFAKRLNEANIRRQSISKLVSILENPTGDVEVPVLIDIVSILCVLMEQTTDLSRYEKFRLYCAVRPVAQLLWANANASLLRFLAIQVPQPRIAQMLLDENLVSRIITILQTGRFIESALSLLELLVSAFPNRAGQMLIDANGLQILSQSLSEPSLSCQALNICHYISTGDFKMRQQLVEVLVDSLEPLATQETNSIEEIALLLDTFANILVLPTYREPFLQNSPVRSLAQEWLDKVVASDTSDIDEETQQMVNAILRIAQLCITVDPTYSIECFGSSIVELFVHANAPDSVVVATCRVLEAVLSHSKQNMDDILKALTTYLSIATETTIAALLSLVECLVYLVEARDQTLESLNLVDILTKAVESSNTNTSFQALCIMKRLMVSSSTFGQAFEATHELSSDVSNQLYQLLGYCTQEQDESEIMEQDMSEFRHESDRIEQVMVEAPRTEKYSKQYVSDTISLKVILPPPPPQPSSSVGVGRSQSYGSHSTTPPAYPPLRSARSFTQPPPAPQELSVVCPHCSQRAQVPYGLDIASIPCPSCNRSLGAKSLTTSTDSSSSTVNCPSCQRELHLPAGIDISDVECPSCQAAVGRRASEVSEPSRLSSSSNASSKNSSKKQTITCGHCQQHLVADMNAPAVRCPNCNGVSRLNNTSSDQETVYCSTCRALLSVPKGTRKFKCMKCNSTTTRR